MTDSLPVRPFQCINCGTRCQTPRTVCPECGQTGVVMVREDFEEASEPRGRADDHDVFRCVACGNIVECPYAECPRCGGPYIAPFEGEAPASKALVEMMSRMH